MTSQPSTKPFRLNGKNLGLVIVDIQEKFRPAVPAFDAVAANCGKLIRAFNALSIPIVATEQYPQGLGPTVAPVKDALGPAIIPLSKKSFSCCGAAGFMELLKQQQITTACVCGIETHVCVYQTVLDLVEKGFPAVVIADACASRKDIDHATALRRMEACGAVVMTVEMVLFDLLRTAEAAGFREVQGLVK